MKPALCFLIFIGFSTLSVAAPVVPPNLDREPMSVQTKKRLSHAKELLGKSYSKSVVRKSEGVSDISEFVRETTRTFLPKAYRKNSGTIAQAVLDSANRFELDPVFLMAVIENESSFNPKRKGSFGEIGLMQLKPETAHWIASAYKLEYKNPKTLYDPIKNIRLGAALMDKLRTQFESQSRLYLSAYNLGAKKVRRMVEGKKTPKEYVMAVMKRYIAMYSAFKVEGDWKMRGKAAFHYTQNVTAKNVTAKNE